MQINGVRKIHMNIRSFRRESKPLDALREKYFDVLEANGVDIYDRQVIGFGYSILKVKSQYATASVETIIEYLKMPEWVANWTREVV